MGHINHICMMLRESLPKVCWIFLVAPLWYRQAFGKNGCNTSDIVLPSFKNEKVITFTLWIIRVKVWSPRTFILMLIDNYWLSMDWKKKFMHDIALPYTSQPENTNLALFDFPEK